MLSKRSTRSTFSAALAAATFLLVATTVTSEAAPAPSPAEVEYEEQEGQAPGREDRVAAQEPDAELPDSFWKRDTLTGDWLGLRDTLAERGIAFGLDYTFDVMGVVAGGVSRKVATLDDWDLTLTIDADKLVGWQGASFFVYGLGTGGRQVSKYAGVAQAVDNMEAPDTWKLYEAWFQQELLDGSLSLLLGLYDLNSEFDVIETASLFLQSSHGIGVDYAQSGLNGPSIFPTTSTAARLRYNPTERTYALFAVLDGVPGDPDDQHGTQIIWRRTDGVLLASEAGYVQGSLDGEGDDPYVKVGIGGWYYSANFDSIDTVDANGDPLRRGGNFGLYGLVEAMLWHEADRAQGLSGWLRLGGANQHLNPFALYVGAGVVYTGPIPERDQDQVGFAIANAIAGNDLKDAARAAGASVEGAEVALELTYKAQLTGWLYVQPDVQYVINPGLSPDLDAALILGMRLGVRF
jgi:porin